MKNLKKKKTLGKKGEAIAAKYLAKRGMRILHTNWTYKHKEIDIICETEDYLVIVEVKTRTSNYVDLPDEMISRKQQRFLIEAAEAYIMRHDIDKETRFDVVIVVMENDKAKVEHIDKAFQPGII
jgi:putative endonuclease